MCSLYVCVFLVYTWKLYILGSDPGKTKNSNQWLRARDYRASLIKKNKICGEMAEQRKAI